MTCIYCGQDHAYTAQQCRARNPTNVRVVAAAYGNANPSWECGSCKAQVPQQEITESYFHGQAVCKDCEEVLLEQHGGSTPFALRPGDSVTITGPTMVISDTFDRANASIRGQHVQCVTMDEVADFGSSWDAVWGRDKTFTIDSLDGRPLKVRWGTD
jgi:hypothetical protein